MHRLRPLRGRKSQRLVDGFEEALAVMPRAAFVAGVRSSESCRDVASIGRSPVTARCSVAAKA